MYTCKQPSALVSWVFDISPYTHGQAVVAFSSTHQFRYGSKHQRQLGHKSEQEMKCIYMYSVQIVSSKLQLENKKCSDQHFLKKIEMNRFTKVCGLQHIYFF